MAKALIASAALLAAQAGATIVAPTYVAAGSTPDSFSTGTPDKLVNNSGMTPAVVSGTSLEAAIAATHVFNGGFSESWVTNDPAPGGGDYFEESLIIPTMIFDLGQDLEVLDLFFWQYQNNGGGGANIGNQVKDIEVRFNTAAEGSTTFAGAPFNVTGLLSSLATNQQNIGQRRTLTVPTTARYVQLRVIDNYFGQPGIGLGGDRVGIGEFRVNVSADPEIVVPGSISASGNGAARTIQVPVSNAGSTLGLDITGLEVTGTDAGLFTVDTATPFTLAPGGSGDIQLTINAGGTPGPVSANLVVTSNDPFASPNTIPITGVIREPWISSPASATAGDLISDSPVQFTVSLSNLGGVSDLTVTGAFPTGPDGSYLTVVTDFTNPLVIPAGQSSDVTFSFDPDGEYRTFSANLEFDSDDGVEATRIIPFTAELVRDPRISAPATFSAGTIPFTAGATPFTVAIENTAATNDLNLSSAVVTGNPDFAVTGFPASIAPGTSGDVNLTFTPNGTSFGIFTATLEIESNDPGQPLTTVTLTAEVLPPAKPGGLVAWWPLDNPADPGNDASGNNLDGVLGGTGALTASAGANGSTGGSLDFDGAVRLTVPQNAALNPASYTITGWASPDSAAGVQSFITSRFDQFTANGNTYGYILYIINGTWQHWTGTAPGGANVWIESPLSPPSAGVWQHMAISYDAGTNTKKGFINGVEVLNQIVTEPYQRNLVRDLHIGAGQDLGDGFFFNGRIDDVAVFNTALSETDINTIRTTGVAGFLGVVLNPYGDWETANNIAGAGSATDSDNDGLPNGIEFVVGGTPSGPDSDDSDKLPTVTVDATYLNFTFRRTDASAGYTPYAEYGSDLTGWTEAEAGVNGVVIDETNDGFGAGIDQVVVRIPRTLAIGSRLFTRLRIDIP